MKVFFRHILYAFQAAFLISATFFSCLFINRWMTRMTEGKIAELTRPVPRLREKIPFTEIYGNERLSPPFQVGANEKLELSMGVHYDSSGEFERNFYRNFPRNYPVLHMGLAIVRDGKIVHRVSFAQDFAKNDAYVAPRAGAYRLLATVLPEPEYANNLLIRKQKISIEVHTVGRRLAGARYILPKGKTYLALGGAVFALLLSLLIRWKIGFKEGRKKDATDEAKDEARNAPDPLKPAETDAAKEIPGLPDATRDAPPAETDSTEEKKT